MEAAMEELFDFIPFKCDSLELSFKIMVEERQRFSRVCGEDTQRWGTGANITTNISVSCK